MKLSQRTMAGAVALLLLVPAASYAQTGGTATDDAQAQTVDPSALNPETDTGYTQQQLDQMLAPIALYPDKMVMNILMAATYPDQLAEARTWLQDPAHADLKGDALLDALKPLKWDPSIKAIVQFPRIVTLLIKNPKWTESLGAAFDNQQQQVMAQIQILRKKAQTAGNLKSNDKIIVQNDGPDVTIAPANPNVVYVPYYNPAVVYGAWPWAAYPPVFFSPTYFGIGPLAVGVGWGWGPAFPIVAPLWGWYGVGWGFGGGIFFHAGFGPSFGWYGHGWGGGGWHGGGWRHGGMGRFGHAGWHGHAGVGQRGGRGGRAGHDGRDGHRGPSSHGNHDGHSAGHGGGGAGHGAPGSHGGRSAGHGGGGHGGGGHGGGGHGGSGHGGGGHGGGGHGGGGHGGGGNRQR